MPDLWYFAYGSNLDPRTFLGRRGMRPREAVAGVVRDWALVFDLAVGSGERAVANVRHQRGAQVWGVAYRIAAKEFDRLDRTEGVHRGAYTRIPVRMTTTAGDGLDVFTYHRERGTPGRKPSRRYLGLLLAGARHHLLPDEWVAYLRALPLAVDEREARQGELFPDRNR